MRRHLSIDLETFSSVDLGKSGLYSYVQAPDFQVLLLAYAFDEGPVQIIDLACGDSLPAELMDALIDYRIAKHAYNAAFEWYCLSKYFGLDDRQRTDWLAQWEDTMLHGLYCGYTAGLAATGAALGLPQDKQKMGVGKALIRRFCVPAKPTKTQPTRNRIMPHDEPEKWELFKEYCKQDVVTEREIERRLSRWPVPPAEQILWRLDQMINAYGVKVDRRLIDGALQVDAEITQELMAEARDISGLDNPKSVQQLTAWLEDAIGKEIEDLRKDTVKAMLAEGVDDAKAKRMLEIRQELSKTSTKKYQAMANAVGEGDRVRGLLQFYGANRTGRWAGRLVQVQNLPRNYMDTLDLARNLVRAGKTDMLKWIYGNVPDVLSQLIRTAFVPSGGRKLIVADFSAIEARVIAWLAGETWRQEVFATHGKIYEASASAMFGVPIDRIKKGNPEYALRQKGKIAELALGYQGAAGALVQMGALNMGLVEEELPEIVTRWREANPHIVQLWYDMEQAAVEVISTGNQRAISYGLVLALEGDTETDQQFMTIKLPSGRKLFYAHPALGKNRWGRDSITYRGMDQTTKRWTQLETYGGKLVENCVQAIARDCLAEALLRLYSAGYQTVFHVHDEAVIDAPIEVSVEKACAIMGEPIKWAPGLLLRADGFEAEYYKKD